MFGKSQPPLSGEVAHIICPAVIDVIISTIHITITKPTATQALLVMMHDTSKEKETTTATTTRQPPPPPPPQQQQQQQHDSHDLYPSARIQLSAAAAQAQAAAHSPQPLLPGQPRQPPRWVHPFPWPSFFILRIGWTGPIYRWVSKLNIFRKKRETSVTQKSQESGHLDPGLQLLRPTTSGAQSQIQKSPKTFLIFIFLGSIAKVSRN